MTTAPSTTAPGPVGRSMAVARPRPLARIGRFVSRGSTQLVLVLIGLFWLTPALGLFVSSLRTPAANAQTGWWQALTQPAELTIDNYRNLLSDPGMVRSIWNTVLITVPSCILVVAIASLAAYAFAWIRFRGRDVLFLLVVALLVVPLQVALIPVAQIYARVGLFGEIAGVVLFHVAFGLPFAIFLLRNFFAGIPAELLEAARMDGASEWRVFSRVVMPLAVPAVASLLIFQFLWVWNDLLVSLVFAGPQSAPLTVAIQQQTRQFGSNIDVISAGAFVAMIIPLVVFFAFQRFFVQGILAGSVK